MHFFYGIYKSPHPATFVRQTPVASASEQGPIPPPSPGRDKVYKPEESMDIVLTSELQPGSTGVVHLGTMDVDPSDPPVHIAVKLAFSESEKSTLEHEFKLYTHLNSMGVKGIPRAFGLFIDDELVDGNEGPYALIMAFAGHSLFGRETEIVPSVQSVNHPIDSFYLY
jgi:hypothetical protein